MVVHTGTALLCTHPALNAGDAEGEHEPMMVSSGATPHAAYLDGGKCNGDDADGGGGGGGGAQG